MKYVEVFKRGVRSGLPVFWEMARIMFPLSILVSILAEVGIIDQIALVFTPYMKYLGLPGGAALVLLTGYMLGVIGSLAVIATLEFTAAEITILAVMITLCHNLFVELAILQGLGVRVKRLALYRFVVSILIGMFLGGILT